MADTLLKWPCQVLGMAADGQGRHTANVPTTSQWRTDTVQPPVMRTVAAAEVRRAAVVPVTRNGCRLYGR